LLLSLALPVPVAAQSRARVEQERSEFAQWLRTSPISPWRAIALHPLGNGVELGPPSADVPLPGAPATTLLERNGRVLLRREGGEVALARGRPYLLSNWRLVVNGSPGRAVVTVFGAAPPRPKSFEHFPFDPAAVHRVTLRPAAVPRSQRLLAPDGVEVEATDAGTVEIRIGESSRTLQVMRLPGATEDESELEIYFRDGTAGNGSYPAGRFVSLIPGEDGRHLLDFNRARNPFCAYNTVYPCPAPWRGNILAPAIRAGERYSGGGLEVPVP
jgi:uncharacterized protein (DUF1684 family)